MTEVSAALGANYFSAHHAEREVLHFFDPVTSAKLAIKTWPAAMAVEFLLVREQLGAAGCTGIESFFKVLVIFTCSRSFSAFFAKHMILFRCQLLFPFLFGFFYFRFHRSVLIFIFSFCFRFMICLARRCSY